MATHPTGPTDLERAVRRACYLFAQEILHRFSKSTIGQITEFVAEEEGQAKQKGKRS